MNENLSLRPLNVGFVSTRFAGTDGVSLETAKWAEVLAEMGHTSYYFAGQCDRPAERSLVVPEAFFQHEAVWERHIGFFAAETRTAVDTAWIHQWRDLFREKLYEFINRFQLDVLIPQNVLAIPLQVPLALALTEVIAETGIPTIAHHHDFAWERKRFLVSGINDYLSMAFPPDLPSIQHVTINSQASKQLAHRRGVGATVVPNVMHFEQPAPQIDDYSADLRATLGVAPDELFVLQPTRVVQRKGIEQAIELIRRLDRKAQLVITHESGDEGDEYAQRLKAYAAQMGVTLNLCAHHFGEQRDTATNGRKIYSLWDAYPHADLVTYPSLIEGFGNAFLEAVYFKKLIVVNNYPIYATDIGPKGFEVVLFDEFVTEATVNRSRELLDDPEQVAQMVETNYQLALRHFSYDVLRRRLRTLLAAVSY